jgi:membrane dipeptidase
MQLIADLHCDLLSYLAQDEKRNIYDGEMRCSLPQLKKGNVVFQTLAIFTETGKKSVAFAEKQFTIFRTLPKLYPEAFERISDLVIPKPNGKVRIAVSVENASGLCSETEPLEACFSRFDQYREMAGPILYISLTWNYENRFGGGNLTKVGLKRDGELLLEYLDGKGIAIDLSHTSDALAHDILDYIDKKGLKIIPLASHSNFRAICDQPRNLSDAIAKEIVKRGGVIGLNFFKAFIGKNCPEDFIRQVDYARFLGAFDQHCFGADFFYDKDLPLSLYPFPFFYERFADAGCYPDVIAYLNDVFTKQELEKIAYKNLSAFFERIRGKS